MKAETARCVNKRHLTPITLPTIRFIFPSSFLMLLRRFHLYGRRGFEDEGFRVSRVEQSEGGSGL